MQEFIIDKPEVLKTHHKVTYFSVTFVFWLIIFYLWQPFISLVAWYFGFQFFYEHMIELGGYQEFGNILLLYTQIIGGLGMVFVLWAKVNEWRFRGKNRRKEGAVVSHQEVADYFKLDAAKLSVLARTKTVSLDISDEMEILLAPEEQEASVTELPLAPKAESKKKRLVS